MSNDASIQLCRRRGKRNFRSSDMQCAFRIIMIGGEIRDYLYFRQDPAPRSVPYSTTTTQLTSKSGNQKRIYLEKSVLFPRHLLRLSFRLQS